MSASKSRVACTKVGARELVGGLLLIAGRLTCLAALVLGADMVGAIVVSGVGRGEDISLTLAPALLVAMVFLVWKKRRSFAGGCSTTRGAFTRS